jgi:uncharacterized protein with HEPN domain
MYDESLILDGLRNIEESLLHLLDRTSWIKTVEDFLATPSGVDMLDVAAIRLMAVGEELKKIDKRTNGTLLSKYPGTAWKDVMNMRNIIAHAYFHIDAQEIFDTVQNDVRPLLATIRKMIADMDG